MMLGGLLNSGGTTKSGWDYVKGGDYSGDPEIFSPTRENLNNQMEDF